LTAAHASKGYTTLTFDDPRYLYWDSAWQNEQLVKRFSTADPEIVKLIARLKRRGLSRVLDIGCGPGRHTYALAKAGFEVFATDIVPTPLRYVKERSQELGHEVSLVESESLSLPFRDSYFHLVIGFNSLYYCGYEELKAVIKEVRRVTRINGYFFFTLLSTHNKDFRRGQQIEPFTFEISMGHGHVVPHHFSERSEVSRMMSGFELLNIRDKELIFHGEIYSQSNHLFVLARRKR
jgi:SAM-dependent methyltransferase